jgi:hypothetical protein
MSEVKTGEVINLALPPPVAQWTKGCSYVPLAASHPEYYIPRNGIISGK